MIRALLLTLCFLSCFAQAQVEEELVVTGIRSSGDDHPAISLNKPADFLLLRIELINDTRDHAMRTKEIYQTLLNAIRKAEKNPQITLSTVQNGFVIPLTANNYRIDLERGKRADTSLLSVRIKAEVPKTNVDPTALVHSMQKFANSFKLEGRVEVDASNEIEVSIVNLKQYRDELLGLITADIRNITQQLGQGYKVVLTDIDRPVQWARSGSTNLSLYIDYRYTVVPETIHSVYLEDY
jgi:hypothetical protein